MLMENYEVHKIDDVTVQLTVYIEDLRNLAKNAEQNAIKKAESYRKNDEYMANYYTNKAIQYRRIVNLC